MLGRFRHPQALRLSEARRYRVDSDRVGAALLTKALPSRHQMYMIKTMNDKG